MKSKLVLRARVLSSLFILFAALLIVRLYFIQIVHGADYARDAMGQYVESGSDTQDRSDIFFTRKDGGLVAAAVMQSGWRIAISPKDITEPEAVFAKLHALVPIDRERYFASVAKKNDPYEEIAFRVSDDAAALIRKQKLPGVLLVQDKWRFYPGDILAARTVGFVGYQGDAKVGVYGLERYWQDTLARTTSGLYVNPFAEIFTNIEGLLAADASKAHGDVLTSVEPTVEQHLEDALQSVMKNYEPKLTGGVVMDPHTGEILAMEVLPSFNPNTYNIVEDHSLFSNPIVEGVYEMGSIMKPLTLASAIDVGVITPSTTYDDKGFVMKSGKKISNFDFKGRGVVSMQEVLNQSLNTGAVFAVDTMGHKVFARYVHEYGLGEKTGIDLPNEATGFIRAIDNGSDVDYASASFGQGIAVSPIEMARALAVLANGGMLPNPHVVSALRYESGITKDIPALPQKQILTPATVETMATMLTTVFDKALLNGELKQEHYSIAAKTGTAQIAIPGGGGYYTDRYLHSFFGFFPSHDPRFLVFLYAVEPKKEAYASHTLARPFLDITKFLINYYDIPPDR